jgi:hypothetical protein
MTKRLEHPNKRCWSCNKVYRTRYRRCDACMSKDYVFKFLKCKDCKETWEWNPKNLRNIDRPPEFCEICREARRLMCLEAGKETLRSRKKKYVCKRCSCLFQSPDDHPRVYCIPCWDIQKPLQKPPVYTGVRKRPQTWSDYGKVNQNSAH